MQLRIQRDIGEAGRPLLGMLSVVDEVSDRLEALVHTQEPAMRSDGVFIPCESPLPPGHYNLSMTHCKRLHKILPLLVSTPNTTERRRAGDRLGMRIFPGHPEVSTGGEIILGLRRADGKVTMTKPAYERFVERVAACMARGEAVDCLIA